MADCISVNHTELTKVRLGSFEKRVLYLLSLSPKYMIPGYDITGYPPEGSCMKLLTKEIYGREGFDCDEMKSLPKAALSRTLHNLFRKGLVRMYWHPRKRQSWLKVNDCPGLYGVYTNDQDSISMWARERGKLEEDIELQNPNVSCTELPSHVKRWWVLTDKGKEAIGVMPKDTAEIKEPGY